MAPVKRRPSVDGAAVFLCLLAAGCGSLTAALLAIAGGALLLLLNLLMLLIFRPLSGRMRNAASLLFAAALYTALRLALAAFRPAWLEAMGPEGLLAALALFSAPAALSLTEKPPLPAKRLFFCAAVLLIIGAARELLSAGTLAGVRLLPEGFPVSDSFAFGGAGLITTALLFALFRIRGQGRLNGYRISEGLVYAAGAACLAAAAGALFAPLTRLLPLPSLWRTFAAAVLAGLLALAAGAAFREKPNEAPVRGTLRAVFADGTLPALASLAVLAADRRLPEAAALPLFGGTAAAALILGLGCALAAAATPRVDTSGNPHLPASFRPLPVWLAVAGMAMFALSVLPK
ncbi:MAG TPA: hypothetical protein H9684_00145 [Firmicutes bacterium]|nr:hypothetical protein [Bacillota bacterium]